jgi:large subunit ribosomal protein L1
MMAKHGKKYRKISEALGAKREMELEDALKFIKEHPAAKFDETMEIAFRMGLDPTKSDQTLRSTLALPHGTGRDVRVVVFASGDAATAAREAGADEVGFEELIEKVKGGWVDFDVAIATTEAMKEVRKLGKVLGPRSLMPNPKTGTVTDDTAAAVKASKAGKIEFRMDRNGNVIVPFGKISFELPALMENCIAVIEGLKAAKPSGAKGGYIKRGTVSSTMGPGIRVNINQWIV